MFVRSGKAMTLPMQIEKIGYNYQVKQSKKKSIRPNLDIIQFIVKIHCAKNVTIHQETTPC